MIQFLLYIVILFAGFSIGRIGHILGGQLKTPHHWIYGVIITFIGLIAFFFLFEDKWSLCLVAFGLGLSVSDLDDMMDFKVYGVDPPGKKRFWNID